MNLNTCRVRIIVGFSLLLSAIFANAQPVPDGPGASTGSRMAYAGVYSAKPIRVIRTSEIQVLVSVWPGFDRDFNVHLPGIVIPGGGEDAPRCQQDLLAKGAAFSKSFLESGKNIEVSSIRLRGKSAVDAIASIRTEDGDLAEQLVAKGYARLENVNYAGPWCKDIEPGDQTTGFWQEMHKAVAQNENNARTGEQVYQYRCWACHGKNTQGAPIPGDQVAWGPRRKKGMDVLLDHAINGYGDLMPPRGGCLDCTDAEIRSAIEYMLNKKEIDWYMPIEKQVVPTENHGPTAR